MGHTWKNGSRVEKWNKDHKLGRILQTGLHFEKLVTLGRQGAHLINGSQLEKWVTVGKNGSVLQKWVTQTRSCRTLRKQDPTWKKFSHSAK